jgi:hypothetical protein
MKGTAMLPYAACRERFMPPAAVLDSYQKQIAGGQAYYREPTPDSKDDSAVLCCAVNCLRPNHYRAVILYSVPQESGAYIFSCESDKPTIVRWLSSRGLPTVRLVRATF